MFQYAGKFNQPIGNWPTAAVTSMADMFENAHTFNQPIGNWNTAAVTTMAFMFAHARKFNQDISKWSTANVSDMQEMFRYAHEFNQYDLSAWDVRNVRSMRRMFQDAKAFKQPLCWNTSTADTVDIFTGTGTGTKPAAAWGKLSARNNCEYDWAYLARRQSNSGNEMPWPFDAETRVWVRYGKSSVSAAGRWPRKVRH
jgi:surface protein